MLKNTHILVLALTQICLAAPCFADHGGDRSENNILRLKKAAAEDRDERATLVSLPALVIYRKPNTGTDVVHGSKGLFEGVVSATRDYNKSTVYLNTLSGESIAVEFINNLNARNFMHQINAKAIDVSNCAEQVRVPYQSFRDEENGCMTHRYRVRFSCGLLDSTPAVSEITTINSKNWVAVDGGEVTSEALADCPGHRIYGQDDSTYFPKEAY